MKDTSIFDTIIIGGGSAGLLCGASFPMKQKGLLLEKTSILGAKLLLSGSGQCNFTNNANIKDFINKYGNNGAKIRKMLYKYSNTSFMDFLKKNNLDYLIREDGKVFPKSLRSKDIADMLIKKTVSNGFEIKKEHNVLSITKSKDCFTVTHENGIYKSHNVIVASGGKSFKVTGSDGKLVKVISQNFNLSLIDMKAALVPIFVENYAFSDLAGVSISNVKLSHFKDGRKYKDYFGPLLFTHRNLSGPVIINNSRYMSPGDMIYIDFMYDNSSSLPKRLEKKLKLLAGTSTKAYSNMITSFPMQISGKGSFDIAMCTAGGLDLSEINLSSMECNSINNLFFIGEVLDIDGDTGGYNLQFAYSSGRACSEYICSKMM